MGYLRLTTKAVVSALLCLCLSISNTSCLALEKHASPKKWPVVAGQTKNQRVEQPIAKYAVVANRHPPSTVLNLFTGAFQGFHQQFGISMVVHLRGSLHRTK